MLHALEAQVWDLLSYIDNHFCVSFTATHSCDLVLFCRTLTKEQRPSLWLTLTTLPSYCRFVPNQACTMDNVWNYKHVYRFAGGEHDSWQKWCFKASQPWGLKASPKRSPHSREILKWNTVNNQSDIAQRKEHVAIRKGLTGTDSDVHIVLSWQELLACTSNTNGHKF